MLMSLPPKPSIAQLKRQASELRASQRQHDRQALTRLRQHLPDVRRPLGRLYGQRPDFEAWLTRFLHIVAQAYAGRPRELRLLDLARVSCAHGGFSQTGDQRCQRSRPGSAGAPGRISLM